MPSQSKCAIFSFDVDVIGYYPHGYVHFCFIFLSLWCIWIPRNAVEGSAYSLEWQNGPAGPNTDADIDRIWVLKVQLRMDDYFHPVCLHACTCTCMRRDDIPLCRWLTFFFFKHWIVIFEGEGFLCSSYMQHFILLVVPDCVCVLIVRWVQFSVATELSPWDELQVSQCRWMWPRDTDFWVCAWTHD